jgi:rod shape-determining protein MreD
MRPLHPLRWIAGPMLMAIAATWLLTTPLKVFGLQLPEPVWPLAPLFAWAVIRPSILAPFAVLLMGLALSLLWGGALGQWALALLVAYGAIFSARSGLVGQSRPIMWAWYAFACALATGAAWLIGLMDAGANPRPVGMFWQFLVTLMAYPFADYLIERFEDADVRFR